MLHPMLLHRIDSSQLPCEIAENANNNVTAIGYSYHYGIGHANAGLRCRSGVWCCRCANKLLTEYGKRHRGIEEAERLPYL